MENEKKSPYDEIENQITDLVAESELEIEKWDNNQFKNVKEIESNLDARDFCFSIAIGLFSPFVSTNEELQEYLKEIHNAASEATGEYDFLQRFLGMLLHHKGDPIDQPNKKFIKRDKENAYVLFHRLLWGHDIFSIEEDNPFFLMIKKQGLSGIIQALQHLLADTTSKQGLPFPGSSYLDFIDENGNRSNYLITLSQQLSIDITGNKRAAQDIYSHMFTVRAADMTGSGVEGIFNRVYLQARAINDEVRIQQFNLISYGISFFAQAIIGAGRLGVPYINIPVGIAMTKSFVSLYSTNKKRIKDIVKKGKSLEKETDRLIAVAEEDFNSNRVQLDEPGQIERVQANARYLIQIWEESLGESGH